MMTQPTLFLDLDGVFADFHSTVKTLIGHDYVTDPSACWKVLETIDNLFLHLPVIPRSTEMFKYIVAHLEPQHTIVFLTALPQLTGKLSTAAIDKTNWVHRHLSSEFDVICTDGWRDKKKFCKPGDVLVDDMARNIVEWNTVGGSGIVHDPNTTLTTLIALHNLGVLK